MVTFWRPFFLLWFSFQFVSILAKPGFATCVGTAGRKTVDA